MRRLMAGSVCVLGVLVGVTDAAAQSWKGAYAAGLIGGTFQSGSSTEVVAFDTNLDGDFADIVRTATGVDAFSPGFCGGLAADRTPAGGCADDEKGADFGARGGYDWQFGRVVVGVLGEISRPDATDSVSAFSTTPAFYTFTREMKRVVALRARAGVSTDRLLIYGTGGPAWARVEQRFTTSNTANTFVAINADDDEGRETVSGYQVGAGVEVRLGGPLSVFGEYLLTSVDNRDESTIRAQGPAPATNPFILVNANGTDLQRTKRFDVHSVRGGVSYRF